MSVANYYTIQDFQQIMFETSYLVEPTISAIFTHILENIIIPIETDAPVSITKPYINNHRTHTNLSSSNYQGNEWPQQSVNRKPSYRGKRGGSSGRGDDRNKSDYTVRSESDFLAKQGDSLSRAS